MRKRAMMTLVLFPNRAVHSELGGRDDFGALFVFTYYMIKMRSDRLQDYITTKHLSRRQSPCIPTTRTFILSSGQTPDNTTAQGSCFGNVICVTYYEAIASSSSPRYGALSLPRTRRLTADEALPAKQHLVPSIEFRSSSP